MYSVAAAGARRGRVAVRADHDVAPLHHVPVEHHAVLDMQRLLPRRRAGNAVTRRCNYTKGSVKPPSQLLNCLNTTKN